MSNLREKVTELIQLDKAYATILLKGKQVELPEAIVALFTHLIEEEAKGMKHQVVTDPVGRTHLLAVGYNKALLDMESRLIEAVKGK